MKHLLTRIILGLLLASLLLFSKENEKKIAYLVSDINIPFWNIMSNGIKSKAKEKGYTVEIYSANNIKKNELENTIKAIKNNVDGLIISPINSSTAVTILELANNESIPTVISDIGTEKGNYVSYISSNNENGAYKLGKILAEKMKSLNLNENGTVGIIAIPQKRENGKARTHGFLKAINEEGIEGAGIYQQTNFSYQETYDYAMSLINENPNLKAIWLQGSDRYQAALDAIRNSNNTDNILLICFDAEPEFIEMIQENKLVGAAMQQPFYMGEKAMQSLDDFLNGKNVEKNQKIEILAISKENIKENIKLIKRNVLGLEK